MKRLVPLLATVTLLGIPAFASAQDTEWNRYTLDELGGVFVRAEVDSSCDGNGVSEGSVQVQVEAALAMSEVELLTRGEMLRNPGLPELRVALSCVPGAGQLAYAVEVRVQQSAQMTRDPQITLAEAVTWYTTGVGVTDTAGAQAALEGAVGEQVGKFATAYVAANGQAAEPPDAD